MMLKLYQLDESSNEWCYLNTAPFKPTQILLNPKVVLWTNDDTWRSLFGNSDYSQKAFKGQVEGRDLSASDMNNILMTMGSGLFSPELKNIIVKGKVGIQIKKGVIKLYDNLDKLISIGVAKKLR